MIGVVDIDMGNLRSVTNAISSLGHDVTHVRQGEELDRVSHLILPGVGSYSVAMRHLRTQGLLEPIRAFARSGQPILGICLGMQLLSSDGTEGGKTEGLALVSGSVVRFGDAPRVPHVGWNELRLRAAHPVFSKVKSGVDFYYVHSFHFEAADEDVLGVFEYGGVDYVGAVARGNVVGFQFHPEKSQANGLRLLENFCDWDGRC